MLERKGARVGLITTEGYRDVMQIARSFVPGGLAGWIVWPKPEPLARLEDTVEIKGRMDARGCQVRPVEASDINAALEKLKRQGIEAPTISLINAYLNGDHELRVASPAAEILPDVPLSMSHVVLPEMQEYERTLTTVANAAARPPSAQSTNQIGEVRDDRATVDAALRRRPDVVAEVRGASRFAIDVRAGRRRDRRFMSSEECGLGEHPDLGCRGHVNRRRADRAWQAAPRSHHRGRPSVSARFVARCEDRCGRGGLIAYMPELTKALRVGPQSADAVPGLAAYGKGGTLPTVTDANVVLGYLPENLLCGAFKLDRPAAQAASDALGIGLMEAARGIIDIVNENMFGALRMISVQQGYDPRHSALMGFGGAGPINVNAVARLMGSYPAASPELPGVLRALGDAITRMRTETARSLSKRLSETSADEVLATLSEMAARVCARLINDGVAAAEIETGFEVDVRYSGQAFEVPMKVSLADLESDGLALLMVFDPEILFNDGYYDLIDIRIPEGSLLKPKFPAALSDRTRALGRLFDILGGLPGQKTPEFLNAAGFSSSPHLSYSGHHAKGEWFQLFQIGFGGIPGRPLGDGPDGHSLWPNFTNVPNEFIERYFPLRIERYATVPDSGGAGLHRGGDGILMTYKFLESGMIAIHDDRLFTYPWGVNGGARGARARKVLRRADCSEEIVGNKREDIALAAGDELDFIPWGSRGWGDPLERDPALVLKEMDQGLVTASGARAYGVVIENDAVDAPATTALREAMRTTRGDVIPLFNSGLSIDELRKHSLAETGLEAPRQPIWQSTGDALSIAAE